MSEKENRLTVADILERVDGNYHYYLKQAYRELEAAADLGKAQKYGEAQKLIGMALLHMRAARALDEMHCFIKGHENDEQE